MPAKLPKPLPVKLFALRWPAMGVVRSQGQERNVRSVEHSTPWAVNVRSEDALTSRVRGGSWTPITAAARPTETIYRDRLLEASGNAIRASRVGQRTDFALTADVSDQTRPALFQLSGAGEGAGPDVVAMVPHKDRHLLVASAGELWAMAGDPIKGGPRQVSAEVGMSGADAWCIAEDTVFFLSARGLYAVSADGSNLKPISEESLPEDLADVSDAGLTLTYHHADKGVYIHLPNSSVSWFFDVARGAFWPFVPDETQSHVLMGPIRIGGPVEFGLIRALYGILATGSGSVTWRLIVGDTAESVSDDGKAAITASLAGTDFSQYVAAQGSWSAGRSKASWPRTRGVWACLWLQSTATWAYESAILETIPAGRWR